ncbi:hypothetical protein [Chachezhania sediminis]|uniref:hypothetical protein n=1 Tax=Chachezhania sediminis TaxID=2599291 RepID=UPI00131DFCDC|nr:hypothetical protein [Chachezhania sediminis]
MSADLSTLVREIVAETFAGTAGDSAGLVIPVKVETDEDRAIFVELLLAMATAPALGDLLGKRVIRFCAGQTGKGPAPEPAKAPALAKPLPSAKPKTEPKPQPKVQARSQAKPQQRPDLPRDIAPKRVITERMVRDLGQGDLVVPVNAVITPLAREAARRCGVTIRRETP